MRQRQLLNARYPSGIYHAIVYGTEIRLHALGQTDDRRKLHISFTLRDGGTLIRVISARDMSRREKDRYAQEA